MYTRTYAHTHTSNREEGEEDGKKRGGGEEVEVEEEIGRRKI